MKARKLRILRKKHGISLHDLSAATGLSPQRISEIELNQRRITPEVEERIRMGLEKMIAQRKTQAIALWEDYSKHSKTLLKIVEGSTYEL